MAKFVTAEFVTAEFVMAEFIITKFVIAESVVVEFVTAELVIAESFRMLTYRVVPLCHRWKVAAEEVVKLRKRFLLTRRRLRQHLQLRYDQRNL